LELANKNLQNNYDKAVTRAVRELRSKEWMGSNRKDLSYYLRKAVKTGHIKILK